MHTTDTIDYGIVVRGEMTLELDDGQKVHLRQGDCIVQNGTRHRWRNPLPEPCLMAFVSLGGSAADPTKTQWCGRPSAVISLVR
jgi:mannose-6-phosphate isomerase-like protein (cupin superfamily)